MGVNATYRVTVAGPLPGSLAGVIRARFAGVSIRPGTGRTALELDAVDQPALRALLTLLWDVGHDVLSVTTEETTP
jgi:hypothetical protein